MEDFEERRGGFGGGRGRFGGGFGGGGRGRGGPRRGGGDFEEKPVKVGEEYDVEIESVAEKGDGVAKIKGLVVFVPAAQKGEKLRIRIKELKRKCAIAEKVGAAAEGAVTESAAAPEEATEDEVEEAHEEAAGEIPAQSESAEETPAQSEETEESEGSEEEY
jgi:predicted RNA-binding protein with TRAM domain